MEVTLSLIGTAGPSAERLRLHGVRVGGQGREPRTRLGDRVCADEGCSTLLSRYNLHSLCWQHEPPQPYFGPADRGRRRRDTPVLPDLTSLIA
jgi:hypothetical protein